jgi:hypothetical protein
VNRSAFQSRTTSDLEKSILVFQALLPITLGNVECNRLGRSQPLITSMTFRTIEQFCDSIRSGDVFDRKSIDIESLVVKDWIGHLRPFEYEYRFTEYEYRFTEYEYRFTKYEYRFTEYEYRFTEYEYRFTEYKYRFTEYEYRFTEYEYRFTEYKYGEIWLERERVLDTIAVVTIAIDHPWGGFHRADVPNGRR